MLQSIGKKNKIVIYFILLITLSTISGKFALNNNEYLSTNNKITIKLPTKNYIKGLKNFMDLSKDNNFDKYKVFDYRINNQLILK